MFQILNIWIITWGDTGQNVDRDANFIGGCLIELFNFILVTTVVTRAS